MKTIFITGASAGLGKATATLFSAKGWKVIATMRNPEKETELTQLENITLLPLDVTDIDQVNATVKAAIELGDIDVVFNNAGYGLIGSLESYSEEQIRSQFETNFFGVIWVTQAFIPYFKEKKSGLFWCDPKKLDRFKIKFFVRELGIPPGSFHLTCFLFFYCCSNQCILLTK